MDIPLLPRLSGAELAQARLPEAEPILAPILNSKSLALLYGPRGLGKTFVALGIARAAAMGEGFLGWTAPRPHRVLYVDGEMAAAEMRQRLLRFGPPPDTLDFILADLNRGPILDLARGDDQARLMKSWGQPELVVLDNLASLAGIKDGDPDRWHELQRFLVLQRQFGRAVLMIHHANKKGLQRGSSRREDVLDLVMAMRRPDDWTPADGTQFEIHFEKTRSLHGPAIEPLAVHLDDRGDSQRWSWHAADRILERAAALLDKGMSAIDMGEALGVSRATAFRLQKRARRLGLLAALPPTTGAAA
ncbi:MAG TPA: AAA family ATPase [Reyranella sp.]|nr:AAA family ATPase [Reyranella sp.]